MNYLRDRRLFLGLIPVINGLNYYLTYTHFPAGWRLPATFLIDTLEGYAAWWAIRWLIRCLDRRLPYEWGLGQRLAVQCVLTITAGVGVIAALTEGVNALATDAPVPRRFYTHDIFIFFIWILVVNGIYVGAYFYHRLQQTPSDRPPETPPGQAGFMVRSGKQSVLVPLEQIAGFCVEDEYTILLTEEGRRYVLDQSLDRLEEVLPAEWFFRLNRQYLVHRQLITGFRRLQNGKLSVTLTANCGFVDPVPVSRTKAGAFKKWLGAAESPDSSPVISLHFAGKPLSWSE